VLPELIAMWFCCQPEDTRNLLQTLLLLYLTQGSTFLRVLSDAALSAAGLERDTPEYTWFSSWAKLTYVTVTIEGLEVEFVELTPLFYAALQDYGTGTAFDCPEPCPLLAFTQRHN